MPRIGSGSFAGKCRIALTAIVIPVYVTIAPAAELSPEKPNETAAETVVLGMSAALSGPTSSLGLGMRTGIEAAIHEANHDPAQANRRLKLVALDDGYEPSRTGPNMRQLIEKERAIVVVGNVGTPTAVAATPIVNETHLPLVGCFTGAGNCARLPPTAM